MPVPQPLATGVNLVAFNRAEIGIGESGRLAARALATTDVPFGIINFPMIVAPGMDDRTWVHKEMPDPIYKVNLFHMNADSMQQAYQHFGPRLFGGRYNIGYWHWELPDFPEKDIASFAFVNEIWVPTTFVLESVRRKSPVPVLKIPHGIEVQVIPELTRETFQLPRDRFLFYTMYDVQSFQARKNPQGVLEAFKRAFSRHDPTVGLVIKLNNSVFSSQDSELLHRMIDGYPNIYIIDRIMNRLEVNSLLNLIDCYVALHRSEGFGLGFAEAMYLGKPVIGTNWSGNTDFMNSANSCPVDYHFTSVGKNYGPYQAYQTWAEPSVDHAAGYMRELVLNPGWRQQIALNGFNTIRNEYSPQLVGQQMKERLMQLGLI